jgi:tetratricopeptide (TPR) repeat protein
MAKPQRRTALAANRAARKPRTAPRARPPALVSSTTDNDRQSPPDTKRPGYLDALAVYEQGIRLIQQHDFVRATDLLNRLLAAFPAERELCERARLYLTLCDRQLRPALGEPQSSSECIYAATLALNAGDPERAIGYLESVNRDDSAHEQALYMLATAHAQRGNVQLAIPYLQQAIESNPDNRILARFDPDLAGLRAEDTIAALLESPFDSPDKNARSLRAGRFDSRDTHARSHPLGPNGARRGPTRGRSAR